MAPIGFFQNHSLFPKLLTQELNCRSLKIINVVHQEPSTNYIPLPIPVPQMSSQHVLHRGGKRVKLIVKLNLRNSNYTAPNKTH